MERVTTLYGVEATDVSASPRKLLRQEIKAAIPMLWGGTLDLILIVQ